MTRTEARELVMKLIYQSELNPELDFANIDDLLLEYGDESNETVFIKEAIEHYRDNCVKIDELIDEFLNNWSLSRIPKVDLAIIRMAINEMLYSTLHHSIIISEAINMTKKYSDEKSHKFVNGILGSYQRKYRVDK